MKKVGWIIVAALVVIAGVGFLLLRGRAGAATPAASRTGAPAAAVSLVKVTRGDLTASVTASGQFQPNTIVTIRPDSNMPTRKIVRKKPWRAAGWSRARRSRRSMPRAWISA